MQIFNTQVFKAQALNGKSIAGLLLFLIYLSWVSGAQALDSDGYVGSQTCNGCHEVQYDRWLESDHFRAMEVAATESVRGNFSGSVASFHGVDYRFYKNEEKYFVDIREPGEGVESFEIKHTFGHSPLQQYLIELDKGRVQALNVAWDARAESEGGQRWFHLQPDEDITPDHPFHWKSHFQNWNARCSDCHSTNLARNYDANSLAYDTTWSEINVACEACHGPGSKHVELVQSGNYGNQNTGLVFSHPSPVQWQFSEGESIANPVGSKSDRHIDMCGSCHALRTQLSPLTPGADFHDLNRIRLIDEVQYFLDGQIREEVYVTGSFMQSKMYEQGVTCINCHNPHSGKLVAEGNSLCAQCHQPTAFDTPDHHHHEVGSTGAQCVNCHMPERTYMQVDNRRDHSFTIPRPRASLDLGVPNACTGCHIGSQDQWAVDKLSGWGVSEEKSIHAYLGQRAQSGDILVTRPLTDALKDHSMAAITRASLLSYLGGIPSRVSIESARASLDDESPLVRVAAVSAMQALPPEPRWQFLSPYLDDPSATVRFAVSGSLLGSYSEYFPEQQQKLKTAEEEYRKMLTVSEDSPATQLAIAELETSLRNLVAAERAYKRALQIEPGYVPAMLNLADYYRSLGREQDVGPLLVQALEVAPDSGAANHSYGLYLIRKQDYDSAIGYLGTAVEQIDAQPRFTYVYAIALESMGRINDAIGVLKEANQRWPNQYDILLAQVLFMEKSGDIEDIYRYISALTAIAPGSPEVKSLAQRFGN